VAEGWARYDSQGEIGRGLTGRVFLALDRTQGRQVAIKELSPQLAGEPGYLARFQAEARLLAAISSPNCVRVLEYFEQDGRHFLVGEYVEGASLRTVMQRSGRLTPEQSLGVLKGTLSGLGYAHSQGVLHRDLKPENVLVDRAGVAKVTDFDQAPAVGGPGAVGGLVHGTPAYMSPEQAQGLPVDARSDIYSAGVMLHELLTGRLPFVAATPAELMRMHVEAPVPDPRDVMPELPEGVAFVVGQAMTKDPATRHQSALDMYNGLSSAAAAGYGSGWEARSAITGLVAAAAAGTAAVVAAVPAAAMVPAAAPVQPGATVPVPAAAPVPTAAPGRPGPPPKLHLLRALIGLALAAALILGGTGYGGSHGVLPATLASASGGIFSTPWDQKPANPGGGSGAQAKARPAAASTGTGATTVLVLDVSGSMSSPAVIPSGFPKAAELKQKQDAFEGLIEEVKGGKKLPLGAIISGVSGVVDLIHLQQELDDYLKAQGVDPATISKLTALKVAAGAMLTALNAERQDLSLDDQAGLVKFSDSSVVIGPVGTDVPTMQATVQGLNTEGSTDIGDGLADALKMLEGRQGANVILLTDGWNNTGMTNDQILSGPVATAASKGVPICAIGLGQSPFDVDQGLLTQIASRTGGDYYFVADRVSLGADMLSCHHAEHGQAVVDFRGKVSPGQPSAPQSFSVPAGKRRLGLTLNWPGSNLDLEVRDPSGRVVGSGGYGRVSHQPGLVAVSVTNPPSGTWSARVQPQQVNPGGEDFFVSGATDGTTPQQHFDAVVGGSANGDTSALAGVRNRTRQLITASAVIAGLAILLLTIRGLARRLRGKRLGYRLPGKFLVPALLYLLAIGGLFVLAGSAAVNFLWTTPLIQAPPI
jgi:Mg-chelatase subunit ChlD